MERGDASHVAPKGACHFRRLNYKHPAPTGLFQYISLLTELLFLKSLVSINISLLTE